MSSRDRRCLTYAHMRHRLKSIRGAKPAVLCQELPRGHRHARHNRKGRESATRAILSLIRVNWRTYVHTHRHAVGLHPGIDLRADPAIPAAHDEPRGAAAPESAHALPLADEGAPADPRTAELRQGAASGSAVRRINHRAGTVGARRVEQRTAHHGESWRRIDTVILAACCCPPPARDINERRRVFVSQWRGGGGKRRSRAWKRLRGCDKGYGRDVKRMLIRARW